VTFLKRKSIFFRSVFLVIVPIALLATVSILIILYFDSSRRIETSKESFSNDNELIAKTIQNQLWSLDRDSVAETVRNLVAIDSYAWIEVRDQAGFNLIVGEAIEGDGLLVNELPLRSPDAHSSEDFGMIRFGRRIQENSLTQPRLLLQEVSILAVGILAVGALILALIWREFIRPIAEISHQIRSTRGRINELYVSVDDPPHEIAILLDSFNGLRENYITEEKRAGDAQIRLQNAVRITGLASCIVNPDSREIVSFDENFSDLHGVDHLGGNTEQIATLWEGVIKVSCMTLENFHEKGGNAQYEEVIEIETEKFETRKLRRAFQVRWTDESETAIVDVVVQDVSRINFLEEKLRQTQKMELVGNLAGGIAHDFNNILAVIMFQLEFLQDIIEDATHLKEIDVVLEAAERGADLTQNMLSFSHAEDVQVKSVNYHDVANSILRWVRRVLPDNIEVIDDIPNNIWRISADESIAVTTLLNLIINARDAMDDGGEITISARNICVGTADRELVDQGILPGEYVSVSVQDTGSGIPKSKIVKIFDPFFTTKSAGVGTGLGLAMVMSFTKQFGGHVTVNSVVNEGTTFTLYYKVFHSERSAEHRNQEVVEKGRASTRSILLVEDEPVLLAKMATFLTQSGFEVQIAKSGDEAAEIFSKSQEFDLLITDVAMPGNLQGHELFKHAKSLDPDLKGIFTSGHANFPTDLSPSWDSCTSFLRKPFRRKALLSAVAEVGGDVDKSESEMIETHSS